MTFESPQAYGLGNYSVGVWQDATGLQILCSMDNDALQGAESDADLLFQEFVDYLAKMPGITIQNPSKSRHMLQQISVTPGGA